MFKKIFSFIGGGKKAKTSKKREEKKHLPPAKVSYRFPRDKRKKKSVLRSRDKKLRTARALERISRREIELDKRARVLDQREVYFQKKEESFLAKEKQLEDKNRKLSGLEQKKTKELEKVARLSVSVAKDKVMKQAEQSLTAWMAKKVRETEESIKIQEDDLLKDILTEGLRRGAVDFVAEYTVSTISIPNENIKGKIIGRDGRNIRAFERASGVELELDEEKEIRISSFDSVRREIAKIALNKLIKDGRVQPSRIETVLVQAKSQMDRILLEEGKNICQKSGVYQLPTEIIKIIGRYKYRFSHGQNLAIHTVEAVKIGVAIAHELKADTKTVRIACLLHDVGKVIDDKEGSHIQVGVNFLKKFDFPKAVIDCVAQHHEDEEFSSVESAIVWISDAVSGARPGARYQAHEEYLKRMTSIEEKVKSFKAVTDVAAYQAGREIRIIVKPEEVSDDELKVLVHKIAGKLDEEAKWAGQIKITAIRETRASANAPLNR